MAAAYLTLSDLEATLGAAMVLRLLDDDDDGVADTPAVDRVLIMGVRIAPLMPASRPSSEAA